jgi:hypothetical protein
MAGKVRDEQQLQASQAPRVRVEFAQLQQWCRTLDQLDTNKEEIERELYRATARSVFAQAQYGLLRFSLRPTSKVRPPTLARHGYSRDGKPRGRRVLVGLVIVDGRPITQHIFAGNCHDAATVPAVLRYIEERFGLRRVVFAGERGMVTCSNLEPARAAAGYIVGLNRRRREDIHRYLERASEPWLECLVGITARERARAPKTKSKESLRISPGCGPSWYAARSDSVRNRQRLRAMKNVRQELMALESRIEHGKLKAPAKIDAAA